MAINYGSTRKISEAGSGHPTDVTNTLRAHILITPHFLAFSP